MTHSSLTNQLKIQKKNHKNLLKLKSFKNHAKF